MRCTQHRWLFGGLALAGPIAMLVGAPPAYGQTSVPELRGATDPVFGAPERPDIDLRSTIDAFGPSQNLDAPPADGLLERQAVIPVAPVVRRTQASGAGLRPVVRDGDLMQPEGPSAPVDGDIDLGPDLPVLDGADPAAVDTRMEMDRAAFHAPPAGFDPLLFQIDGIETANPRLNRRPRRLFTREPYDPVGVRVGSLVLFPEVETGLSWSSNVFASPSAQSDRSYDLRPSARLVSNWNVHAFELRGSAELSTFDEFKTEDARGYLLEARGRLDVTRRTNAQGVISREVAQESRSAVDALSVGDRVDVTVDTALLSLNHRFNRLSLQLRGAVSEYGFGSVENAALGNGGVADAALIRGTINNNDRDYIETRQALRATWEFKPTLRLFGESELIQRDYDIVTASDGISRDSQGGRYRVGVDFGSTGAIWRGEVSLGYGDHRPKDARLATIDGLIVDANMAWRVNGLTSVLFTARSDITETTTARSGGVLEHQGGMEVRHAFREHLIGSAGISYTRRNISGIEVNESDLLLSTGVEYFVNPSVVLFGTYGHTFAQSDFANSDYDLDEIHIGVRVRR